MHNKFVKILAVIFCLGGVLQVFSQTAKCDNIQYDWLNDNEMLITYDLMGEVNESYDISIFLMMVENSGFKLELKSTYGDIGSGIKTGINKRVVWKIFDDYKNIQEGAEYYFAIDVDESGGSGWLYYVLGGAAAIVTGVFAFGGGGDNGGGTATPTSGSFPLPPSR